MVGVDNNAFSTVEARVRACLSMCAQRHSPALTVVLELAKMRSELMCGELKRSFFQFKLIKGARDVPFALSHSPVTHFATVA